MFFFNKRLRISRPLQIGVMCFVLLLMMSGILFMIILRGNGGNLPIIGRHHAGSPVPSPSASVSPFLLTPTPLFVDDFANSSKDWPLTKGNVVSDYTRTMENNKLTLSVTNHKILVESVPTTTIFSNFTLTLSFALTKGDENDSVGLYLRGDSNLDHDYRIDIFGDKTVSIGKEALSNNNTEEVIALVNRVNAKSILHDKQNTLVVAMKGTMLTLTINDKLIGTVIDSDYQSGQISLFVQNGSTSDRATATFSSIEIDPLPDLSPTPQATP